METKLPLSGYVCSGRYSCKNANTEKCHATPKKGEKEIVCKYYEQVGSLATKPKKQNEILVRVMFVVEGIIVIGVYAIGLITLGSWIWRWVR